MKTTEILGYQPFHPRAIGNTHQVVLELIPSASGRALDAAAGDCWVASQLARKGYHVAAVDIDFDVTVPEVQQIRADLNAALPFESETFDLVVSIETIEHLENPWAFIRELARVTHPGGTVVATTPNVNSFFSRLLMAVNGRLLWFQERDLDPLGHITPIHLHLLKEMGRRTNLSLANIRYSKGRIPLLNMSLPLSGPLFGESIIAVFRKGGDS